MNAFLRPNTVDQPVLRLIGFHHAGGSAAGYFPLHRELPGDWDLLLLDLPGRGRRAHMEPLRNMRDIVEQVVSDIQPWLDVPVALFGHSMGAVVAVETARALEAEGTRPVWVGVSARSSPAARLTNPRRYLHALDDQELLGVMYELGGIPDKLRDQPEFLGRFLRTLRADLSAVDRFETDPGRVPLRCPLTAFGGVADSWAPPHEMMRWEEETSHQFFANFFPGGHFYFTGMLPTFAREMVSSVATALEAALAKRNEEERLRTSRPRPASAMRWRAGRGRPRCPGRDRRSARPVGSDAGAWMAPRRALR